MHAAWDSGDLAHCLAIPVGPVPLAKIVTDAFLDQLEKPQWQLEKSLNRA